MYAATFGLAQEPFSIAPDPRFLFMSERHREALAHLLYGLKGGGGFVLLTGEVGAGKTTVARCFLEQIPKRCNVAYVFNPKMSATELLQTVCDEFHVPVSARVAGSAPTLKDHVDALNRFLLETHAVGQNNVLVIDEAQNLEPEVLEQLRLLTNLETSERKLLQIVLIGQPELRTLLAQPGMAQLAQRVIARCHLDALGEKETAAYVRHRLAVAGARRGKLFDGAALARIHQRARGVPRRINLLADRALLGAYAAGRSRVDAATVDRAADEVFDEDAIAVRRARLRIAAIAGGGVAGGALLASAAWWFAAGPAEVPAAVPTAPPAAAAPAAAGARADGLGAVPAGSTDATRAAPVSGTAGAASAPAVALVGAVGAAAGLTDAATAAPAAPAPAAGWSDEGPAWRALGQRFGLPAGADPCAPSSGWTCLRGRGDISTLRRLDRPVLVPLRGEGGVLAHAVVVALGAERSVLATPAGAQPQPLPAFAARWTGAWATLWRPPPGSADDRIDPRPGPGADWLEAQLARVPGLPPADADLPRDEQLRARVRAFQAAHGLRVDGVAGPITLMRLQRSNGAADPRLDPAG
jgi:general secretion pathway protein A